MRAGEAEANGAAFFFEIPPLRKSQCRVGIAGLVGLGCFDDPINPKRPWSAGTGDMTHEIPMPPVRTNKTRFDVVLAGFTARLSEVSEVQYRAVRKRLLTQIQVSRSQYRL